MNDSISDASEIEKASWRDFIQLTKPGIIRSNLIAAFGGFMLASKWDIDWFIFVYMMIGTALIMASGCVLNNFLDREMDQKMERTKERSLPSGRIHPKVVFWYGITLGIIGLIFLYFLVNPLSALLGFIGFFVYVFVYTMWLKRNSTWSTSIGGISGAMPPVLGYCAVTNEIDAGAWLLFALLFLWQPPHFWALGIRRKEEYRAAGFPLLPVVKGVKRTKIQMIPYVLLLFPVNIMLYQYDYVGWIYLIISTLFTAVWLVYCLAGFVTKDDEKWARKTFLFSINYLMVIFLVMIINTAS
ncbi:heme o synthase [Chengkuizengella sp. 2205SS18-9]|uniref:Protoheme IX farnesyltransferase n=2 Tax=Chengkuizengella axinellae TaxID=3064388 RepID=A0ABT9IT59_9BACL|nr:heme o synthase [Chengkuizengella sp. 2205SS18-9]MDP5272541.1 heme o synthase [Chengkuizengella sp. 2205SS18-9]